MKTVRLSARSAQRILRALEVGDVAAPEACDELRRALRPSPKKQSARKATRQRKDAKRATKREETSAIYLAVEKRAAGCCEYCGGRFYDFDPPELDHQLGRGKARQSVENCWLIHRTCHRRRTRNEPSAAHWWDAICLHATKYGHHATETRAADRYAALLMSRGGGR